MSTDITAGGRFDVAFSFYSGQAGALPVNADGEIVLAIRIKSVRGSYEPLGTIAGQQVEIRGVGKSPVEGYTRVTVRLMPAPAEEGAGPS